MNVHDQHQVVVDSLQDGNGADSRGDGESEDQAAAVQVLRDMRDVKPRTYNSRKFMDAFKKSGLSDTLAILTDPHTYHWRDFLGEMVHRFTPEEGRKPATNWDKLYKNGKHKMNATTFIVKIMCDERFQLSMASSCDHIYFLSSMENWKCEFKKWVGPTIRSMALADCPNVDIWDIELLFRDLCSLKLDGLEVVNRGWEMAKKVLVGAQRERGTVKRVNQEVHRPEKPVPSVQVPQVNPPGMAGKSKMSAAQRAKADVLGSKPRHHKTPRNIEQVTLSYEEAASIEPVDCPNCAHKEDKDCCVVRLSRKRLSAAELAELRGALFTCAPPDDVFQTPQRPSDGRKVISPVDLKHMELEPREDVLRDCHRDIRLIEDEETSKLIGGVLWGAWSKETLEELRTSHKQVARYVKASRRKPKSQVVGKLVSLGSRQPMGGMAGDGYGPYVYQSAADVEGVDALFAAARDSDILMETVRGFAPEVVKDIKRRKKEGGLNNMGRTGMNSFYCWEYASPLHEDDDNAWSICCQLWKSGCKDDKYNFAYAEWGIYIRTQDNCIWFFNPRHLHGTILPRQSSVDSAISRGTHTTVRRKDMVKATLLKVVRESYEARTAFWNTYVCK
ncbi:hypothetical protein B0H17DRAFT_1333965 [Mycena rosella]|uniref:Uncharacterized protein n=1 Tax=Mycena rosella TaxID=1033263 RepID=A0AAD7D558_MYCRO|nr:hypothetical protein B0H17DRAFT_1333965 [Mycena rosella]